MRAAVCVEPPETGLAVMIEAMFCWGRPCEWDQEAHDLVIFVVICNARTNTEKVLGSRLRWSNSRRQRKKGGCKIRIRIIPIFTGRTCRSNSNSQATESHCRRLSLSLLRNSEPAGPQKQRAWLAAAGCDPHQSPPDTSFLPSPLSPSIQ